jgi:hypothetical protein
MVRAPSVTDRRPVVSWRAVVGRNVRRLRWEQAKPQEVLAQEVEIVVRYHSAIERRANRTADVLGLLVAQASSSEVRAGGQKR